MWCDGWMGSIDLFWIESSCSLTSSAVHRPAGKCVESMAQLIKAAKVRWWGGWVE